MSHETRRKRGPHEMESNVVDVMAVRANTTSSTEGDTSPFELDNSSVNPAETAVKRSRPLPLEKPPSKMRAQDSEVVQEALQYFFGKRRGRPDEGARRIRDAILTVFSMHKKIDAPLLARYLKVRASDLEKRLQMAQIRADENSRLPKSKWKWWDKVAPRSDAFSTQQCAEAATFWKSSDVSKQIARKGSKKYQQIISNKEAHRRFLQQKRVLDPQFSVSLTWFLLQRPKDVKKFSVRGRKSSVNEES